MFLKVKIVKNSNILFAQQNQSWNQFNKLFLIWVTQKSVVFNLAQRLNGDGGYSNLKAQKDKRNKEEVVNRKEMYEAYKGEN